MNGGKMGGIPATLLACGVITRLGAVVNTAKVELGSSVVVIGTGGLELNAIQGAALSGAYPLIAVDSFGFSLIFSRPPPPAPFV